MTGSNRFPRVQAIPQVGRVSICLDGAERLGYEFGQTGSRPFLFPLIGPAGAPLTRLGHPNPIGHDYRNSIWFGHENVAGVDFWHDRPHTDIRIRHRAVRLFHDGPDWGGLVADLDWWADGRSLVHQELTIVLEPDRYNGFSVDLQSRFECSGQLPVEFGPAHFGFLGIQIAKTMSEQYGGGRLTAANGSRGETSIFDTEACWVDCSGPTAPGKTEGVCVMDHPTNSNHPTRWYVRGDGCVCPSFSPDSPHGLAQDHSLALRYRLLVHSGLGESEGLNRAWDTYANTAPYMIIPPRQDHLAALRRGEMFT